MVSILNLSGAVPLMVDVRQTGGSPVSHRHGISRHVNSDHVEVRSNAALATRFSTLNDDHDLVDPLEFPDHSLDVTIVLQPTLLPDR
jgi:hypothetical protein